MLEAEGFFVVRAAKSGYPDLIALKTTRKFACECKAGEEGVFIDKPMFGRMLAWEQQTGLPVFLAWKLSRQEWKFFPLKFLKETERGFSLGKGDLGAGMTFAQAVG